MDQTHLLKNDNSFCFYFLGQFKKDDKQIYANETQIIKLYGIPITVPTSRRLLRHKLNVRRELERDKLDIANLIGIFYLKNEKPKDIIDYLTLNERRRLYKLLKEEQIFIKEQVLMNINSIYLNQFKNQLKKRT